jgi:hypothetical protein
MKNTLLNSLCQQKSWSKITKEDDVSKNIDKSKDLDHKSDFHVKIPILLESLFTRDDQICKNKPSEEPSLRKIQDTQKVNIGTQENPKYFKLGKHMYQ